MGRAPCCDKANVKKGPWSPEEDAKLKDYIDKYGTGGNWIALPQKAGLRRCGKSCRLRWLNYLRPNIKHGEFTDQEDRVICSLFASIGSRWSIIAGHLPGRTDNDIKNYWNTKLKKKLMGMIPPSQKKLPHYPTSISSLLQPSSNSSSPSSYGRSSTSSFEPISFSQSLMSSSCSSNILQTQESFMGQMQHHRQANKDNLLIFGGTTTEASCSSSDGSCNNHMISQQGREIDHSDYFCNRVEENQKIMISSQGYYVNGVTSTGTNQKQNGSGILWGEGGVAPLEYGLEEIKQLISSSGTIASSSSNFMFDENKTEESSVMYY
ncbi:hypothetical protein FNV43_RR15734 [Rhamnella rubrinervis]|uniref:Transcription factor RAX2 n=1 Tax=Rhamnella rubrinervis TaxID=2594499 RepID=A0A8K0GX08_9ROSA|nr:hypothetical protein FNV43_RR15734 [Rhamnella rubrinervis]